ncbi:MAG TPA: DUF6702 family protein [Pyrinomonadaceae bacterium]|jgi:hypothetical protein
MKGLTTNHARRRSGLCHLSLRLLLTLAAAACIALSPLAVRDASAHKFYTSISHAEYNPETKSLEIVARVFSDDLELALTRRNSKAIYLDSTKEVSAYIVAYLKETFEVKGVDEKRKEIKWVGLETKVDTTWLYFEIKMPEGLKGTELRNRLFFELFSEQVNIVNIKDADNKFDLVFKRGDEFKSLNAPSETAPAK